MPELVLYGIRLLAKQLLGTVLDIEVDHSVSHQRPHQPQGRGGGGRGQPGGLRGVVGHQDSWAGGQAAQYFLWRACLQGVCR